MQKQKYNPIGQCLRNRQRIPNTERKIFLKEDLKRELMDKNKKKAEPVRAQVALTDAQLEQVDGGIVPIPTVEAAIRQEPDCPKPNSTGNEQTACKANARFIF